MPSPIRIAIAEDHKAIRGFIKEYIEIPGEIQVCILARNGQDLVDQIAASAVLPDIALLDISMPVLDGIETLTYLRQTWPKVKTIMVSMYFSELNIRRAFEAGANGIISKSDPPEAYRAAITEVHLNGFYSSPLVPAALKKAARQQTLRAPNISQQEMRFLKLCGEELSYKQIAAKMGVSIRTVHGYRDCLCKKLDAKGREGLIITAFRSGIIVQK